MTYKIRFAKLSVADLEEVMRHTLAHFGERQHEEYKALVRQALTDIAADPVASPAKQRPELHPGARTFHLSRRGKRARHFFLYRVVGEYVEIGRLLHDSMDLRKHIPLGFDAPTEN